MALNRSSHVVLCLEANLAVFASTPQGSSNYTAPQQGHRSCMEAISENAIHRAANSNETTAQRVQRQQALIASQLQLIDSSLPHDASHVPPTIRNNKPQRSAASDDLLYGVGSQFGVTPGSAR